LDVSTFSFVCLAVANKLGRWIDLDGYCLDAPLGLVASPAACIVTGGCFVFIEEGGRALAAHAGIAHNTDIPSESRREH
jgi:hypothetical protein